MTESEDDVDVNETEPDETQIIGGGKKNPNFEGLEITDPNTLNKRRFLLPLFLVYTLSVTYIVLCYVALPLVINVVTTRKRISNGEIDPHTNEILASSISQYRYTWVLFSQKLATLLTSNFVGAVADVFGRKPLILVGVIGYIITEILFLVGWFVQSWECFLVGSIALGCVTPIIPIIIAVAGDISDSPNAFTLHSSHVFGLQNIGLLSGMLVTVGLRVGLANDAYFVVSFVLSGLLSLLVFMVMACYWSESLPREKRKPRLDWRLANPFGFLFVVFRNPYIFLIWGCNCLLWFSLGASEAVFANWWMLRYFITDTRALPLLWFLVATWIFTGVGQFILPKIELRLCGQKLMLHFAILFGLTSAIVVSYAQDPAISYVGTAINFFASPGPPGMLALFLAQSETSALEGGAMTGVYRASQAGFRMIGSAAVGSYFSDFIAPFTPDNRCVPTNYHPLTNPAHNCPCGVKSCPINDTTWLPSVCTYGRLTPIASTQPGYAAVPIKKLIAVGNAERCGTPFFGAAREISVARAWCAGPDPWVGCSGLDVPALTRDAQVGAVLKACVTMNSSKTPSHAPSPAHSLAPTAHTLSPSLASNTTNTTGPTDPTLGNNTASNATQANTTTPTTNTPTPATNATDTPTTTAPTSTAPTTIAPTTTAPTTTAPSTITNTSSPTTSVPSSPPPTNANSTTDAPTASTNENSTLTTDAPTSTAPTSTTPPSAAPTSTIPTSTTSSPTTSTPTAPTSVAPVIPENTTTAPTIASATPTTIPPTITPTTTTPTAAPSSEPPTMAPPTPEIQTTAPTTTTPTTAPTETTPPTTTAPTETTPPTTAPTMPPPTIAPTNDTTTPRTITDNTQSPSTHAPTHQPTTRAPTHAPTKPTTRTPTAQPTYKPLVTRYPTPEPPTLPTTRVPSTHAPTAVPTTHMPTVEPTTTAPTPPTTHTPTATPTAPTTHMPTEAPSTPPTTKAPTFERQPVDTANTSTGVIVRAPRWVGGPICNAVAMAALKMGEFAAFDAFRAGQLTLSNQTLDPLRRNRSLSIYSRKACPEEGDVTISLCRAGSLGPRPEEPSMFMFFYPILAAYVFYAVAEFFFRRYEVLPPLTELASPSAPTRMGEPEATAARRGSEEVMLPPDPLATLKRDHQDWDDDEETVTIHPVSQHGSPTSIL